MSRFHPITENLCVCAYKCEAWYHGITYNSFASSAQLTVKKKLTICTNGVQAARRGRVEGRGQRYRFILVRCGPHFMFAPMCMALKSYRFSRGSAVIGSDYIDHGQDSIP